MEVCCPRCKHNWDTKSKMYYATCPRCRKLFKIREVVEDAKNTE